MSRRASIFLLGVALVGLGAWLLCARPSAAPELLAPAGAAPAGAVTDPPARNTSAADRLAEVERIVAERNRAAKQDEAAFVTDGWTMVKIDPPDARLTSF